MNVKVISRDIKDHLDIGLNADWCVSTYQLGEKHFIFDDEDDFYSLCKVDLSCTNEEEKYDTLCKGSFEQCVDKYEKIKESL